MADRLDNWMRNLVGNTDQFGEIGFIDRESFGDCSARELALLKAEGEHCLLDIGQIEACVIFLTLGNNEFVVTHLLDDSPDPNSELRNCSQSAVTIGNLVVTKLGRMRTDEDRNLLTTGSDSLNEGIVGSIRPVHSISN